MKLVGVVCCLGLVACGHASAPAKAPEEVPIHLTGEPVSTHAAAPPIDSSKPLAHAKDVDSTPHFIDGNGKPHEPTSWTGPSRQAYWDEMKKAAVPPPPP